MRDLYELAEHPFQEMPAGICSPDAFLAEYVNEFQRPSVVATQPLNLEQDYLWIS